MPELEEIDSLDVARVAKWINLKAIIKDAIGEDDAAFQRLYRKVKKQKDFTQTEHRLIVALLKRVGLPIEHWSRERNLEYIREQAEKDVEKK